MASRLIPRLSAWDGSPDVDNSHTPSRTCVARSCYRCSISWHVRCKMYSSGCTRETPQPCLPSSPASERKLLSRQKNFRWSPLLYIHPSAGRDSSLGPTARKRSGNQFPPLPGSQCSGQAVGGAGLGEPPTPAVLSEGEQASGGTKGAEDVLSTINQGHSTGTGNEKRQTVRWASLSKRRLCGTGRAVAGHPAPSSMTINTHGRHLPAPQFSQVLGLVN